MLTDQISLSDGVDTHDYMLVSREGMNSVRREITAGVPSVANSALTIKHTLDAKAKTKPNRHLVSITFTEQDASGIDQAVTVHAVVTRAKGATDACVLEVAAQLAAFLSTPANITSLLIGSN